MTEPVFMERIPNSPNIVKLRPKANCLVVVLSVLLVMTLTGLLRGQTTYYTNNGLVFGYVTTNGQITITQSTRSHVPVVIPGTINGLPVTSIATWAFEMGYITSVVMPDSVTNIGQAAFFECSDITNLNLGRGVIYIGAGAFGACNSLGSVTIPASVETMVRAANIYGAFGDCRGLTNIVISQGVKNLGDQAFALCDLAKVIIPNSMTNLGDECFGLSLTNSLLVYFLGNAPALLSTQSVGLASDPFRFTSANLYYLPGTLGWSNTYDGLSVTPWYLPNPTILNFGPNFGVQSNQFGFMISWATNASVAVDACTNISNPVWSPVSTNALTNGSCYFSDPQWTNYPGRYYRVRAL